MAIGPRDLDGTGKLSPARGLPGGILPDSERAAPTTTKLNDLSKLIPQGGSVAPTEIGQLTSANLLEAHLQLHEMYRRLARPDAALESCTDDTVNLHARIVDELFERGIEHPPPPDDRLDARSSEFERSAARNPARNIPGDLHGMHPQTTAPNEPPEQIDKAQAFGTFGGSHHYAKRIVPLIAEHDVYVEPFAGAAAVLYAKDPSPKETLADKDPDVVFLHRFIKEMTPARVEELNRRFEWTCTEQSFARARDMHPKDDAARFYQLVFVRTHARDCRPDGTHPAKNHLGSTTDPEKYLRAAERLKNVTILHQDYRKTVAQLDGPDTFFFLDPPYPDEWYDKDAVIDIAEFAETLRSIKGRFIAVLNDSAKNAAALKAVGHTFRLSVHEASGTGGAKKAPRLVCSNFQPRKAEVEKYLFGYPAGKAKMANKLLPLIPEHKVYIEPFAGSAAVFFGKDPVSVEVLNDRDDEVMGVLRAVKALTDADVKKLSKANWISSKSLHASLRNAKPTSNVDKVYRYLYLSRCSFYTGVGGTYSAASSGTNMRDGVMRRIEKARERFHKGVKILVGDYERAISEHDSKDAFIFLDPPYPGYNINVGESEFDEERFRKVLQGIKGKFLVTYGAKGKLDTSGFHVRKVRVYRSLANMPGVKPTTVLETLLISNFKLPSAVVKAMEEDTVEKAEASDPYLEVPDESRKYPYVVQHHFRGKSLHADLRIGFRPDERLIGWTLNTAIAGAVQDPITTLAEAKALAQRMNGISKINWHTGEWAERREGGPSAARVKLQSEKKPTAPWIWLGVEGRTEEPELVEPPPAGATRNFPGVFHIVDKGLCEFGIQRPGFHEYFLQGDALNYRLLFRLLRLEQSSKSESAPCQICKDATASLLASWVEEIEDRSPVCAPCLCRWMGPESPEPLELTKAQSNDTFADEVWVAMRPDELTPSVLSPDLGDADLPAVGVSALPQAIRAQVPDRLRYWEARSTGDARRVRDALIQAIADKDVTVDMAAPYRAQRRRPGRSAMLKRVAEAEPGIYEARIVVPIIKVDREKRLITGEVLVPDEVDAQNDTISAEIIEKAEHRFLANFGRDGGTKLGVMHKKFGDVGIELAESWIAKEDSVLGGRKIKRGTWLMTIKVISDSVWNQVKRGALTGFSIGGVASVA